LSLSELVAVMQEEFARNRQIERETLQQIAGITTVEFAEQAAAILDPAKHAYSFEGYLIILQNLREVIAAGMPEEYALDAVQTAWSAETILEVWRGGTKGNERL
jgi:hypothetical protein